LVDLLDLDVQVLLLLQKFAQLVLILEFVRNECVELLCGIVFDELDYIGRRVLSYSSLVMRVRR
jgi:hypothetical protein